MQAEELKDSFTARYILAITIIAILSSVAFFTLHYALKMSDSTALHVNMAGKQRMLSQRVALLAQHYYLHVNDGEMSEQTRVKIALENAIHEMGEVNERLSSGWLSSSVRVELSKTVHEIYFGKTALKSRVENYLALANRVIYSHNNEEMKNFSHMLSLQSDDILPDLNAAVLQNQKEGEANLAWIKEIEVFAWILTFLTLLLEILFIFRPMSKKIEELFDELISNDENLEVEIERRTLNLEQTNLKLQQLASHDPLTGLKNRLNLEHDLEDLLFHFKEHHYPFAVAMIDIDWFKKINDNFGHDIGDMVLKELSFLISNAIRSEDSAYRAGGEEFVIVFNRISSAQAIEKMEALRQMVEKYNFKSDGITIHLTISGGLYHPDWIKVDSVQHILKLSDEALYQAKRIGRNKVIATRKSNTTLYPPLAPAKSVIKIQRNDLTKTLYADFDIITILGYVNEEFTEGKITFKEILHPDDFDFFERLYEAEPFMTTLRVRHADGNIKIIKIECTLVDDLWKFEIQDPIALSKSVEDSMIVYNFDAMMNNSDDFIYFKDRYHVFTAGSKTLVTLTNVLSRDELVGKTDYEVFPSEYADKYFKLEKEVFSGEIEVAREIQPILDNNGHAGWVDNRKYPIKNDAGEIVGLFGIARVMSEYNPPK